MRVISQNGNIDFPYENIAVAHAGERVAVKHEGKDYIVAEYSSNKKSYKAMEMLRDAYLSRMELDGGYDAVSGCYVQPNYWVLPKVFQFPKDEEIEVEDECEDGEDDET